MISKNYSHQISTPMTFGMAVKLTQGVADEIKAIEEIATKKNIISSLENIAHITDENNCDFHVHGLEEARRLYGLLVDNLDDRNCININSDQIIVGINDINSNRELDDRLSKFEILG